MQVPEANSVIIPAYWALGFKHQFRETLILETAFSPYAGLTACIFDDNFSGQKSTVE